MPKNWVTVEWDNCPYCGNIPEILTDCKKEGYFYDGDDVRCVECGCPGYFSCDEEEHGYINWHEEPGCTCEWCVAHPEE